MKHLLITLGFAGLLLAGCTKENKLTTPVVTPDPNAEDPSWTGTLEVTTAKRALVTLQTNLQDSHGAVASVLMRVLKESYDRKVLAMILHVNDTFSNSTTDSLLKLFPTSGLPNFHVGNIDAALSPNALIPPYITPAASVGVAHRYKKDATLPNTWIGQSKLNVFHTDTGKYYMTVFVLRQAIAADTPYFQADADTLLKDTLSASYFVKDAGNETDTTYYLHKGDKFMHSHLVVGTAKDIPYSGLFFATSPKIGTNRIFNWTATVDPAWGTPTFMTIVWRRVEGKLQYVNGFEQR